MEALEQAGPPAEDGWTEVVLGLANRPQSDRKINCRRDERRNPTEAEQERQSDDGSMIAVTARTTVAALGACWITPASGGRSAMTELAVSVASLIGSSPSLQDGGQGPCTVPLLEAGSLTCRFASPRSCHAHRPCCFD
jgi:hypothetical protein